jgi:diaminopimelate decarboxylase
MNSTLVDIAQRFGTPCYVYFMQDIAARCEALRQAFAQRFKISYAVKANPNAGLLQRLRAHTDALDISSAGEMRRALRAGWLPQHLSFTGPGKRAQELVAAVTQEIAHNYPGQEAFDLGHLATRVNPALDALLQDDRFRHTVCMLETGRYLVGEAGIFVTQVIRIKVSRGTRIAICDGGMHHHLAACGHLGTVFHRNYRIFKVNANVDSGDTATYELVGPLCTPIDTLGHAVELPTLDEGDLIGIHSSGAYGLTVSPIHFIGHPPPKEIVVESVQGQPYVEDISQFTAGAC